MNRVYRLVWSEALHAFLPVPECAGGGKRGRRRAARRRAGSLAAFVLVLSSGVALADPAANALPTGGQIVSGGGSISQTGSTMTINQSTSMMIANWSTFNIGSAATVQFVQPRASSVALNRVSGGVSQILGALKANGQVYLINPNGIVFGQSGQVDVGGLVASTLNIANSDFLAGRNVFSASSSAGSVANLGRISSGPGGVVALIAPQVRNEGSINAPGGTVALAAGNGVTLDFVGDGLVNVTVDQAAFNALVANKGLVVADGGMVVMSARSANALLDTVVNNSGIVQANTLSEREGRIVLDGGETGTTQVTGTLKAAGTQPGQHGGGITVTGNQIAVGAGAVIDASGPAGGGSIAIGGGRQGLDPAIRNANGLGVDPTAVISANATDRGNGGSIVLWSNGTTDVAGTISALGGPNGGAGGYVETSGHMLNMGNLRVNVGAVTGAGGNWLIDPQDLAIDATGAGNIGTALTGGATVTVTTSACSPTYGTCSGNNGDITVGSTITATGAGSLVLQANRNISVSNGVNIVSDGTHAFNVTLTADSASAANSGYVALGTGTITTSGGNIVIGGGSDGTSFAQGTATANAGVTLAGTTLNAGSGTIAIKGQGYAPAARTLQSDTGSVTSNDAPSYGVLLSGTVAMTGSVISVTGTGGAGQDVTNPAATGPATTPWGTAASGASSGAQAHAGNGASGVEVASGASVTLTGTTSATITATGGNGGAASTGSNYGGKAYGGNGANGYDQNGDVAMTSVLSTINGVKGTGGSASSTFNYEYDGGHSNGSGGTAYQGLQADSRVSTTGGDAGSDAYGIYVNGNLSDSVTSNTMKLASTGNAYQNAGALTAVNLLMAGNGGGYNYTFEQSGNNVSVLAASASNVYYRDADMLQIGTVGGTSGITTGSSVYIQVDANSAASAALIQNASTPISAGSTGVFTANTMLFNGGSNSVTGTNIGLRTTTGSRAIVIGGSTDTTSAGTDLFLSDTSLAAFSSSISQLAIGGNNGAITVQSSGATFKPSTSLVAGSGALTLTGAVSVGSGKTLGLNTTGTFSNTGAVTASNLVLNGATTFVLNNADNVIGTVAANVTSLDLIDTGNLAIGAVSNGTINTTAWSNPFSSSTIYGITAGNRVYVNTPGNLTINLQSPTSLGGVSASGGGAYTTPNTVNPANINERMGAALVLVAGGSFINNNNATTALTASGNRWLVYSGSTTQVPGTVGSYAQNSDFKFYAWKFLNNGSYNVDAGGFGRTLPSGSGKNGYLYTYQPTAAVSPTTTTATGVYGNTPSLTAVNTGANYSTAATGINGDTITWSGNNATFATTATSASNVGAYNINYSSGLSVTFSASSTITSGTNEGQLLGYAVTTGTPGTYTVTTRPVTVTPNTGQSKTVGTTDPTLLYTVGGSGLVNGDTLTGALTYTGSAVGNYVINQGTVDNNGGRNSNYAITYSNASNTSFGITDKPFTPSSLTSVQTGITGTSTNSANSGVQSVGAGTGSGTVIGASTTQLVTNSLTPPPSAPIVSGPAVVQGTTAAQAPEVMTLSSGGGGQSLSVSSGANGISVTFSGPANTPTETNSAAAPVQSSLSLFTATGTGVVSQGNYVVAQKGSTLSASAGAAGEAGPTSFQNLIAPAASGSIGIPGGGSVPISVGISSNGVLVIQLPPGTAQKLDPQTVMLIGLALAKQNFGSAADGVKSVLLQSEP